MAKSFKEYLGDKIRIPFFTETGIKLGEVYKTDYYTGMDLIEKHFHHKLESTIRNLTILEKRFGPITWRYFEIKPILVRKFSDITIWPDLLVTGSRNSDGEIIQYRYYQGTSDQSGQRKFKIGSDKMKLFTTLPQDLLR